MDMVSAFKNIRELKGETFMSIKSLFLLVLFSAAAVFCADEAAAKKGADKQDETKLISLGSMEQAFAKALNKRRVLANYIVTESAKYNKVSDADKKVLEANIAKARQNLAILNLYMDVVFGIGNRREYEYDQVKSTIYLKVGTVKDTFARTVNRKSAIATRIAQLDEEIKKEQDKDKAAALKTQQDNFKRAYAIIENALFAIYQIHPKRQYTYDQNNGMLYLKSNAEEINKLQEEINKNKAAKDAAEKKALPAEIK